MSSHRDAVWEGVSFRFLPPESLFNHIPTPLAFWEKVGMSYNMSTGYMKVTQDWDDPVGSHKDLPSPQILSTSVVKTPLPLVT